MLLSRYRDNILILVASRTPVVSQLQVGTDSKFLYLDLYMYFYQAILLLTSKNLVVHQDILLHIRSSHYTTGIRLCNCTGWILVWNISKARNSIISFSGFSFVVFSFCASKDGNPHHLQPFPLPSPCC